MNPTDAVSLIREKFGVEPVVDGPTVTVALPVDLWREAASWAKTTLGCRYFNWLSAVDWKAEGLEVVCRVENLETGLVMFFRTRLGAGDTRCPSLVPVYRGADWMERECYDMFGVAFDDHPDLRRILLPQEWEGHPLRKDYAIDTPHAPYR